MTETRLLLAALIFGTSAIGAQGNVTQQAITTLRGCRLVANANCKGMDLREPYREGEATNFPIRFALKLDGADFSGAKLDSAGFLKGASLVGAKFDNASMKGTDLTGTTLTNTTFRGANLAGVKLPCTITSVNFSVATLSSSRWSCSAGKLTDVDLSGASLPHMRFSGGSLVRVTLKGADLTGATFMMDSVDRLSFAHATLDSASFDRLRAGSMTFTGASMMHARVAGTYSRVPFDSVDARDARFAGTFDDGSFRYARLDRDSLQSQAFRRVDFSHATLDNAVISAQLVSPTLTGTSMVGTRFERSHVQYAPFKDATLSGAVFHDAILDTVDFSRSTLDRVLFDHTSLNGVAMGGAKAGTATFKGGGITGSLQQADFRYARTDSLSLAADLAGATFESATLTNLRITDRARLVGTNFTAANLTGAFISCESNGRLLMSGVDFSKATLTGFHLNNCTRDTLTDVKFESALLSSANLSALVFTRAKFAGATLTGTNFSGSRLGGADFKNAPFDGTQFQGADLTGATLPAALGTADFSRAVWTDGTRCAATSVGKCVKP